MKLERWVRGDIIFFVLISVLLKDKDSFLNHCATLWLATVMAEEDFKMF